MGQSNPEPCDVCGYDPDVPVDRPPTIVLVAELELHGLTAEADRIAAIPTEVEVDHYCLHVVWALEQWAK